jgi:hypothetical protein
MPEESMKILKESYQSIFNGPSFVAFQKVSKEIEEQRERMTGIFEQIKPSADVLSSFQKQMREAKESYVFKPQSYTLPDRSVFIKSYKAPEQNIPSIKSRSSYHLPTGSSWVKLTIKFFDGHTVKVSYPGLPTKTFDYKDMGFVDNKTNNPNNKWKLLQSIAENGGRVTNAKYDRKFSRNIKYELNIGLKTFFNMTENPISNYTKNEGYVASFIILKEG